jgi:hypothetical protein
MSRLTTPTEKTMTSNELSTEPRAVETDMSSADNPMENEVQSQEVTSSGIDELERERWLAIRRETGLKIDPQTAEVDWTWAAIIDPYGVYPELAEKEGCVGRVYFARSPGSDIWVHFDDLPEETREALRNYVRPAFSIATLDGCPEPFRKAYEKYVRAKGGAPEEECAALDAAIAALIPG